MSRKLRKLPEIPAEIYVPAGAIPVEFNEGLFDRESSMGKFNWLTRNIELEASMELTPAWLTLEHERTHAILMDAGIELEHALEERVCDAIALARVVEMSRGDGPKKAK